MKMNLFKTSVSFAAIVMLSAPVGAVSITTDTVVTEADVADYIAADIDIATGVTLTFSGLTTRRTFTGKLTGGGNFAVVSPTCTSVKMTLSGDATEFTGQFCFTNHAVAISSPVAVGDVARINLVVPQASSSANEAYQCVFKPSNATYHNYIDANVGGNNGIMPEAGVTLAGPIFWRAGRLYGNVIVTGVITINNGATFYCRGGVKLRGGVTSTDDSRGILQADGGDVYIECDVEKITGILAVGEPVYFGKENALAETMYITLGVSYRHYGKIDLKGWNQRCGRIKGDTDLANQGNCYITSSSGAATLSILNQPSDITWYGNLNDKASLSYASANGSRFTYNGLSGSSTGSITVESGCFRFATNSVCDNLTRLVAKGTGVIEFPVDNEGGVPHFGMVNPGNVVIAFADSGMLDIATDVVIEASAVTLEGEYVEARDYTQGDGTAVGAHIIGGGTLRVLNSAPVVESDTFTWVGGTDGNAIASAANWKGGVAPTFDGTERLVFGEGTAQTVVSGTVKAYAIDITTNSSFTIQAANDSAKILLGAGGLTMTNTVDSTVVTHSIACPVELLFIPQTWHVAANAALDNLSPIIARESQAALTIKSHGRVNFRVDNSTLLSPLAITEITPSKSQPYVYNMKGLGPKTRATTIDGCPPLFWSTPAGCYTNETPLRIRGNVTGNNLSLGSFINSTGGSSHLYLMGKVSYFGGGSETYMNGNVHFLGGVTHEAGADVTWRIVGADDWLEGDGFRSTGALRFDYGGTFHIAAPSNEWSVINPYKCVIKCYGTNVMARGKPICMSDKNNVYRSSNTALDMNGYDQSVSRMYAGWTVKNYPETYTTLKSETMAMLEIATDAVNDDVLPLKVTGAAGIKFNAAGSLTFTNFTAETTGTLEVDRGTVRFAAGSGWIATTNIVLNGGTIAVASGAGAQAFGPEQGRSAAWMTRTDGAMEIAAGEQPTVYVLAVSSGNGHFRYLAPGIYGGSSAGLDARHTLDWIAGGGTLRVLRDGSAGTIIIFN